MKENKLADISTDFFVQIIVLVKDPKAKHGTKLTNRTLSSKRQRQAAFFNDVCPASKTMLPSAY
ncbi:MAG: hypothetical protein IJK33_00175 [Clostridia bacterium]|nr:hypothetical protein [Clostridia bacterium]